MTYEFLKGGLILTGLWSINRILRVTTNEVNREDHKTKINLFTI